MRLGWKGLPGTHTLAYSSRAPLTKIKKLVVFSDLFTCESDFALGLLMFQKKQKSLILRRGLGKCEISLWDRTCKRALSQHISPIRVKTTLPYLNSCRPNKWAAQGSLLLAQYLIYILDVKQCNHIGRNFVLWLLFIWALLHFLLNKLFQNIVCSTYLTFKAAECRYFGYSYGYISKYWANICSFSGHSDVKLMFTFFQVGLKSQGSINQVPKL